MKRIKKIAGALLIVVVLIQFIQPARNRSSEISSLDLIKTVNVPGNIQSILKTACYDCHSNNTVYPWYSKIQPVDWWLTDHINEGKTELNFDEFTTYNLRRQYRKLDEVMKQVKDGEMPLNSYTWIHNDARLSDEQKNSIINWAGSIRDEMKNKYPIDSLERPKK